jgi:hypothetical protein
MDRPIIIISLPRSGSSMTAGIFANHGVWTGPCRGGTKENPKGHFESTPLKKEIIATVGPVVHEGRLAERIEDWPRRVSRILKANGYKGGPWLFKGSAMYYPLWVDMNPHWVCVRRNIDAIKASGKKTGYLKHGRSIPAHVEAMDYVRDHLGGVDVFTDDVIRGDYSSLERAFDHAGIEMDRAIVDDFVDPGLWHY